MPTLDSFYPLQQITTTLYSIKHIQNSKFHKQNKIPIHTVNIIPKTSIKDSKFSYKNKTTDTNWQTLTDLRLEESELLVGAVPPPLP